MKFVNFILIRSDTNFITFNDVVNHSANHLIDHNSISGFKLCFNSTDGIKLDFILLGITMLFWPFHLIRYQKLLLFHLRHPSSLSFLLTSLIVMKILSDFYVIICDPTQLSSVPKSTLLNFFFSNSLLKEFIILSQGFTHNFNFF